MQIRRNYLNPKKQARKKNIATKNCRSEDIKRFKGKRSSKIPFRVKLKPADIPFERKPTPTWTFSWSFPRYLQMLSLEYLHPQQTFTRSNSTVEFNEMKGMFKVKNKLTRTSTTSFWCIRTLNK